MPLKTDCAVVAFFSSSGHCSLDCSYCIINPIAKHEKTLDYEDLSYFLAAVGKKAFLIFSGKGDFFAGYRKNDRLLEKILRHDVEIALDINGVMLHEFSELPAAQLNKIRHVNLTMHYRQLSEKGALNAWRDNALLLLEKLGEECELFMGFILSPAERPWWHDALEYYKQEVFAASGRKIVLVKDIHGDFMPGDEKLIAELELGYPELIEHVHQENFSARFSDYPYVICPAGVNFFRVWNDGKVEGCRFVPELADCGNLKSRTFHSRKNYLRCTDARYCECNTIAELGKMKYPEAQTISLSKD